MGSLVQNVWSQYLYCYSLFVLSPLKRLKYDILWIQIVTGDVWYNTNHEKIGGFFKVNCGAMDGDLRRLKKILEAKWLIYHTKRDRKSFQQILQIFIFNGDRLRTQWMKKKMATQCPSRKLQMITFNIQPKHSYVNSIHI